MDKREICSIDKGVFHGKKGERNRSREYYLNKTFNVNSLARENIIVSKGSSFLKFIYLDDVFQILWYVHNEAP